jgi:1-aminocyclopropane-1-carboxylate deaminase/D-cysteine desulfhydrase-like pyridoxal-dependent ACC family enzyme
MKTDPDYSFAQLGNAVVEQLFPVDPPLKQISVFTLRLDKIHAVVSGNKFFKLKYYLADALDKNCKTILTFGGAWSNHIIATAWLTREMGFRSIGIIRGEQPASPSETLRQAASYGMELHFLPRKSFAAGDYNNIIKSMPHNPGELYVIPQGGAGDYGVKGSMEILSLAGGRRYSHVLCSMGTGTMFTGLINSAEPDQEVIGIPAIRGITGIENIPQSPLTHPSKRNLCKIIPDYHFGGYAKKTPELIQFMNTFYARTGIPTDFVYTGKLFFACMDLLNKNYFPPGSSLLVVHSGGLQGNMSLEPETLEF